MFWPLAFIHEHIVAHNKCGGGGTSQKLCKVLICQNWFRVYVADI